MEAQDSATIRFCGRLSLREETVDLNIANFLSLELGLMLGRWCFCDFKKKIDSTEFENSCVIVLDKEWRNLDLNPFPAIESGFLRGCLFS